MLNRVLIAWIVYAGVMGFAVGGSFVSAYQIPLAQHETSADPEQSAADQNAKEKSDEALARYTWWLTIFTGILAFATIGLGVATIGLYAAGEKQFRLARQEFIATHRPKIKFHIAEITRRPVDDINRIGASILCFNTGEAIAKNVEVRGEIFAGSNFAVDVQRPIVKTFSEVLSGQKLRAEINSDYPVVDVASGKRRGVDYHCIGWIAYWDENGLRRETAFCLRAEFSDRDRWVSAGKPEYEYDY